MPRKKVLLTVTTYPLPSRSYDELVCTAGVLETGEWIRIYPVPLHFLTGQKKEDKIQSFKYTWIELDLVKRTDDFRPESYSPKYYDFRDLKTYNKIDTKSNWASRKEYCLKSVYTNLNELINASKDPNNKSLATFKPTKILQFDVEEDERQWKNEWIELRKQGELFPRNEVPEQLIKKLPYKFYYVFKDDSGKKSRMMIEDWEIGQLYWNCLKSSGGNERAALDKVRKKYEEEFISENEIYFFLGTTKQWHYRRALNPFVIVGVFYPKKQQQLSFF